MKVRFIFYRAKFEFRNFLKTRRIRLVDDAISFWTWFGNIRTGPYAHVEVWTPDEGGKFEERTPLTKVLCDAYGTCWTSTMRGEDNGTVKRPVSEVLTHPERWDYIEVDLEEYDYNRLIYWMELEVENNKGYDMKANFSFLTPWRFHDIDKNNCSEFGHNAAIVAMIKGIIWTALQKQKAKLPHDFYVWPMPSKIAELSRHFKVPSPRRLARMFTKAGYKMKRLK